MIQLNDLMRGMIDEEHELNKQGLDALGSVSDDTILLFTALQAIHKRQRDGIMLALRTSNG